MKHFYLSFLVVLATACNDFDFEQQSLCTFVSCGSIDENQVNVTVYNNTQIDFEELIWSVGGQADTINVLAYDQFSCWKNYDSLTNVYIYAIGISEEFIYSSDTLLFDSTLIETVYRGNFRLTISKNDNNNSLSFSLYEGYDGGCVSF